MGTVGLKTVGGGRANGVVKKDRGVVEELGVELVDIATP